MTTPIPLKPADITGASSVNVLARLLQEGPPYLFGSADRKMRVGDRFTLDAVDGTPVLFEVTRMSNAREFREKYPLDVLPNIPVVCYYEAEVRD